MIIKHGKRAGLLMLTALALVWLPGGCLAFDTAKDSTLPASTVTQAETESTTVLFPSTEDNTVPDTTNVTAPSEDGTAAVQMQRVRSIPTLKKTGNGIDDFVPEGWVLFDSVELDFNEDGIVDYVGILEYGPTTEQDVIYVLSPRILFSISSGENGAYVLDFWDINLIRSREEGGVFGDPYLPLTAEGTSFTTHAFGGSAWKWSEDYTYTYLDGEWYLTYSEESSSYGPYTTDCSINDYLAKKGIRKVRSDAYYELDEDGYEPDAFDLVYEIPLDDPFTLYQASMRWPFSTERKEEFPVKKVTIADGISISVKDVKLPAPYNRFRCNDEKQLIYIFSHNGTSYLASYRFEEEEVSVLAEHKYGFWDVDIYKDKIIYSVVNKEPVCYWYSSSSDGAKTILQSDINTEVRLYQMKLDGSQKKIIFDYHLSIGNEPILETCPQDLYLFQEISGGQIVAEVDGSLQGSSFYRIDLEENYIELIGTVPAEW